MVRSIESSKASVSSRCSLACLPRVDHGPVLRVAAQRGIKAQICDGNKPVVTQEQGVADHCDAPVPDAPAPMAVADDAVEEDCEVCRSVG